MTHVVTSLCLRDESCVDVCPVECMILGKPVEEWPWLYIDPDTCIDCGACIPECPFEAIFTEEECPSDYVAKGGEYICMPLGTPGFETHYEGTNEHGDTVVIESCRILEEGEVVDLTPDINPNYDYFGVARPDGTDAEKAGPGYEALNM